MRALAADGDAVEGDDDAATDRRAEDAGGLEDVEHELLGDLLLDLGAVGGGDEAVVVDLAAIVDGGVDDDGGVVVGEDGTRAGRGVEIVGRGDGVEGDRRWPGPAAGRRRCRAGRRCCRSGARHRPGRRRPE